MYNLIIVRTRNWLKRISKKPQYDFLDLGCKKGSSIGWSQRKYGGKGLGVDLKLEMVEEARKNGFDAIRGDVLKLDFPKNSFRYVAMMDFLEHLPSKDASFQVLKNCKKWSREFFFIHHPSFEDIDYLKNLGLKIDWTDGYDHTNPLTLDDLKEMFNKLRVKKYEIEPKLPIVDSSDKHILPLTAPHNTILYSKNVGTKTLVKFDHPVYSRFEIVVYL
jgi:SAM-dependent methyltransferase